MGKTIIIIFYILLDLLIVGCRNKMQKATIELIGCEELKAVIRNVTTEPKLIGYYMIVESHQPNIVLNDLSYCADIKDWIQINDSISVHVRQDSTEISNSAFFTIEKINKDTIDVKLMYPIQGIKLQGRYKIYSKDSIEKINIRLVEN